MTDTFERLESAMAEAKQLPTCRCCDKQSDGVLSAGGTTPLCGTCFDDWSSSHEYRRALTSQALESGMLRIDHNFMDWLDRRRAERQNGAHT